MINGDNPNTILLDASRNVLSFNVFVNLVLLHFIEYTNNKKLSFLPVLLFVVISVWAVGRAGIICAISYLLYSIYRYFLDYKIVFLKLYPLFFAFILFYFAAKNISLSDYFYRIQGEGIDYASDVRSDMLINYLKNIDFLTFLFGYNYYNDAFYKLFNMNPHNSYIRLHSYIGFLFFPFIFFILYRLINYMKNNTFFFVALILLLFRGWIDIFFFIGIYDFLVFILLLYNYESKYISFNYENHQSG
jgi:hypothetical protein